MIPVPRLFDRIADLAGVADGLTVSGGEPFEQPEVLALVLRRWRQISDQSTFVFTGWEFEDLAPWLAANEGLVDAVMTGPFRSELPQTRALRGSDNQTLHVLSELGAGFLAYERPSSPADRRLDIEFDDEGGAWFAGIPARGDLARLRRAFTAAGHCASTSDMVGGLAG
jgi:anaerobic ribonucleoside-triphosphate reductase activating protein